MISPVCTNSLLLSCSPFESSILLSHISAIPRVFWHTHQRQSWWDCAPMEFAHRRMSKSVPSIGTTGNTLHFQHLIRIIFPLHFPLFLSGSFSYSLSLSWFIPFCLSFCPFFLFSLCWSFLWSYIWWWRWTHSSYGRGGGRRRCLWDRMTSMCMDGGYEKALGGRGGKGEGVLYLYCLRINKWRSILEITKTSTTRIETFEYLMHLE